MKPDILRTAESLYPGAEFPRELDICLTDGCNLDCAYCYFAAKNRRAPVCLTGAQVEKALDLYLDKIRPQRIQKLSFSGGEPLLCFNILLKGLELARKKIGSRANIEVFTNGTLLDRRKAELLLTFDPVLIISMDGAQSVCDANRKFYSGPRRSVYRTLSRNLKLLGREIISRCCAGATFSRSTVSHMSESVEFLLDSGFKCVIVDLDVLARWDEKTIGLIRRQAEALKRLYTRHLAGGFGEVQQRLRFDFIISREELRQVARPMGLKELSLAPDGCFYPSGLVSGHDSGKKRYIVGDLERGFDYKKMNAVLSELRDYFGRHPRKGYNGCPTHVYFSCRLDKRSPERLFNSGEKLFEALDPVIGPVIDYELLLNTLASMKNFGDFEHIPRGLVKTEIAKLEVELSAGSCELDAATAREALDTALYSPGEFKRFVFAIDGAQADFEKLRQLSTYALMKARRLSKKPKMYLTYA